MYSRRTGLTLGFHGCDKATAEEVICGRNDLNPSQNSYDWLGNGIYFWEYSPSRALEFAQTIRDNPKRSSGKIENPAVIGAVINLGFCLDLLDYKNLELLKLSYEIFEQAVTSSENLNLPRNKRSISSNEILIRELDCAVIETLHRIRENNNEPTFDSVRGVFSEGSELYPNAGFKEKDHIQICIRNPNCIKGYFFPRSLNKGHQRV